MARLTKQALLDMVEHGLLEGGWSFLCLSSPAEHPVRYSIFRGDQGTTVRIYIWNLTPGGRNRPQDEWRIQATGVERFQSEASGETLILGWEDDRRVFVGFDFAKHQEPLGHSPSIQLRERALDDAAVSGFSIHNKGNGELAVAFRADFLATYIVNARSLHACGEVEREIDLLQQISADALQDTQVGEAIAEPRRFAVIAAQRALRENGFRRRVLTAYGHSCAMCGVQLRLLDAAHILPAAHRDSTDGTNNGVALCALHHRAFDGALVMFDTRFRIHVSAAKTAQLAAENKDGGLTKFRQALRPILSLPPDSRDRPAPRFVELANRLRGWAPD